MDFLNKSFAQLKDLLGSMTPGARITAALLLAVVVVSLAYLVMYRVSGGGTYLMGGEMFSPRELPKMEAAFAKAGLGEYEIEGGRIRVPRGQQHAYIAALAEANALPHNFGDILQRAMDDGGPFEDARRREERLKIAIQRELALNISVNPSIESALVLYDEQRTGGLHRETVRTASVSVKPVGPQLDESLVPAIRYLVAGAVAGLDPGNVTVTDLNSGRTFHGSAGGLTNVMEDPYLARKRFYERQFKENIQEALSYVPGVVVTCNVELDEEQRHREEKVQHDPKTVPVQVTDTTTTRTLEGSSPGGPVGYRSQSNTSASLAATPSQGTKEEEETSERQEISAVASTRIEKEMAGLTPERVTVAVAVPDGYFRKVWHERNPVEPGAEPQAPEQTDLDQVRQEEVTNIRNCVAAILPAADGAADPTQLVTVTVFPEFKPEEIPAPSVVTNVVDWLGRYWSTLGMIGLAFFSLWVLRSMVRSTHAAPSETGPITSYATEEEGREAEGDESVGERTPKHFQSSGQSLRDELSELVGSDPETAANILRTWIGSAS